MQTSIRLRLILAEGGQVHTKLNNTDVFPSRHTPVLLYTERARWHTTLTNTGEVPLRPFPVLLPTQKYYKYH